MARQRWICDICGCGHATEIEATGCESQHVATARWIKGHIVDVRYSDLKFSVFPDQIVVRYTDDQRDDRLYALAREPVKLDLRVFRPKLVMARK